MRRARVSIIAIVGLLAACSPVPPVASPSPAPAAPSATPPQAAQPSAIPPGSTILACTPIEDKPPPAGQVSLAQPFSLVLDRNGRPLRFLGNVLPARIPFMVDKIEPAAGPPGMRVGAVIHYATKDTAHEMYSAVEIMKDGTYQLGVLLKTPTQSTGGLANAGHGTCVSKPA